ncbi:hypothetical protein U1Q18_006117 [Sarracenia purpurea var. burkii]
MMRRFCCHRQKFPPPKSPTSLYSDHHVKAPACGRAATAGIAVRHVRCSHSGKLVRVKKDMEIRERHEGMKEKGREDFWEL